MTIKWKSGARITWGQLLNWILCQLVKFGSDVYACWWLYCCVWCVAVVLPINYFLWIQIKEHDCYWLWLKWKAIDDCKDANIVPQLFAYHVFIPTIFNWFHLNEGQESALNMCFRLAKDIWILINMILSKHTQQHTNQQT